MTSRITGDSKTPSTASIIRASGADTDDRQGARDPRTRPAVEPMVQGDRGRGHREAFQAGGQRGMDARDTADPGGVLSRALLSRDGDPLCGSGDTAQSPAERVRRTASSLRTSVGPGRSAQDRGGTILMAKGARVAGAPSRTWVIYVVNSPRR